MQETKELPQLPHEGVSYQPEPETVAGFIASISEKVSKLLAAARINEPRLDGR